jgi:hypothetical protein
MSQQNGQPNVLLARPSFTSRQLHNARHLLVQREPRLEEVRGQLYRPKLGKWVLATRKTLSYAAFAFLLYRVLVLTRNLFPSKKRSWLRRGHDLFR